MSRMNELAQTLDELVVCGETLIRVAKSVRAMFEAEEPALPEPQTRSFEEVRGLLAAKSREGFRAEVKALLGKYGCDKLSDVQPEDYTALYEEAEGIGNG